MSCDNSSKKTLTATHECFIKEYLIDLDAGQAAARADYLLIPCDSPQTFYVYALIDPTNQEIFYIGKGSGKRYAKHVAEWKARQNSNARKHLRIGQIRRAGLSPLAVCLAEGMLDVEAYAVESAFIRAIGLDRLTNTAPGLIPLKDEWQAWAVETLQQIKSYERWYAERERSAHEQEMYWQIVHEIEKMAAGLCETERVVQVNPSLRYIVTYNRH